MTSHTTSVDGWRAPVRAASRIVRRTAREMSYLWLVALLAVPALVHIAAVFVSAAVLLVTVVGLSVPGRLVRDARRVGRFHRELARWLLGVQITEPDIETASPPPPLTTRAALLDPVGWRALLFMLISVPVGIAGALASAGVLLAGLAAITQVIWSGWLPLQVASDGAVRQGVHLGDWFIYGRARQAGLAFLGLLVLLTLPIVTRIFAAALSAAAEALLGPSRRDRESMLRRSRDDAVDDADARLRRIERDLHDGTQARLVAVAMQLGEAREQLADGSDPELVARLLDDAHTWTKATLVELREIAQGIHPAALDDGLGTALVTLASRSAVPAAVDLDPDLEHDDRLPRAVQSIAYYCVAELLTNVIKHAAATRVEIAAHRTARDGGTALLLTVSDDGRGGASPDAEPAQRRTGLTGLADRLASIEGTLEIDSPPGGPTLVTATLPLRSAER